MTSQPAISSSGSKHRPQNPAAWSVYSPPGSLSPLLLLLSEPFYRLRVLESTRTYSADLRAQLRYGYDRHYLAAAAGSTNSISFVSGLYMSSVASEVQPVSSRAAKRGAKIPAVSCASHKHSTRPVLPAQYREEVGVRLGVVALITCAGDEDNSVHAAAFDLVQLSVAYVPATTATSALRFGHTASALRSTAPVPQGVRSRYSALCRPTCPCIRSSPCSHLPDKLKQPGCVCLYAAFIYIRPGSGSTGGNIRGTLVGEPGSPIRLRSSPGISSAVTDILPPSLRAACP